ncbi:hypothetical protein HY624_01430 [Candidatus Uhrbacteria bacterium]|nr:hypothetical protein [Candidatus Uhrbacteria bacterium]
MPQAMRFGAMTVEGTQSSWYWNVAEQRRVRPILITKLRKNSAWARMIVRKFFVAWHAFDRTVTRVLHQDFSSLSLRQLGTLYTECVDAALVQASYGYIVEPFLTAGEEDWLVAAIRDALPEKIATARVEEITRVLTTHTIPTFSQEEAWSRAALAKKARGRVFDRALKAHVEKFATMRGNYYDVPRLTEKEVRASLRTFDVHGAEESQRMMRRTARAKARIVKQYRLHALASLLDGAEQFAHMQDYRKWAVTKVNDVVFQLLDAMAPLLSVSATTLRYATPNEIVRACMGKRIDWKSVGERSAGTLYWCTASGVTVYQGKALRGFDAKFFHGSAGVNKVLKGTTAMPGKVRGRVRIVYGRLEFAAFKKGEILVTNNTTPEFVPTMKRAAAIVTEQGGITSHAAIISRELKVPCIIGTKVATKVFKTGDRVEVDAENGVVRKI